MSEIRFDDRVAIVTGAGGGLGRAHAVLLASRGAKIVVNDLGGAVDGSGSSARAADAVVEEIRAAGGEAVASHDAVDDPDGAGRIIDAALSSFGKLDIVINNAGILRDVSFLKMDDAAWESVIRVHLTGTMRVSKAAWPHLRKNEYGRVVNTTSAAGLYGNFGQANYSAAKMGIVGLTKTLAHEGAKYGITVNAIAPGTTLTPRVARVRDEKSIDTIRSRNPMRALVEPIDTAEAVLFLASDAARYITGVTLNVNAGNLIV
jgi:NAD(P)-dependent dehydrogenase (short-subunit alcohol dehydrogenase family)